MVGAAVLWPFLSLRGTRTPSVCPPRAVGTAVNRVAVGKGSGFAVFQASLGWGVGRDGRLGEAEHRGTPWAKGLPAFSHASPLISEASGGPRGLGHRACPSRPGLQSREAAEQTEQGSSLPVVAEQAPVSSS